MIAVAFEQARLFWLGSALRLNGMTLLAAFIGFYILLGINAGIFASDLLTERRRSVALAARTIALASAAVVLLAFFLKAGEQISRMELTIGGALSMVFVCVARSLFCQWTRHRFGSDLRSDVLILDEVSVVAPEGAHVISAEAFVIRSDLTDPLMLDRIGQLLAPADRVVIACPSHRRRAWAMILKGANIQGEIFSPELNDVAPLGTGRMGDCTTIVVAAGSLDLRQRCLKRALDLTIAVGAIVLLAPLLLLVAVAVKCDSPGPVLFVQDRVGRGNRLFGILKFRSMHVDCADERGSRSASRGDERITRVGRFIRATSIDELPQIINVLKGEMSFVGPRPHALGSLAGDLLFWEVDERYWHRHTCKPGLTGLAQIRGYRGATNTTSDLTNRLQADLEYVSGWTVFRDIAIILATLRVVIHRNAY